MAAIETAAKQVTQIALADTLATTLEGEGRTGDAQIVRGVLFNRGEDVIVSVAVDGVPLVSTPRVTLERAAQKFRGNRENPEALADLLDSYWKNFGAELTRSGRSLSAVDLQLPQTTPFNEIDLANMRLQAVPDMGYFHPPILAGKEALPILDAGLPNMYGWLLSEGKDRVEYTHNSSGWMIVESTLYTPYPDTTQKQAEDILKDKNRLGFTAGIDVGLAGLMKEVEGRYIDERSASRLLGVLYGGGVLSAGFDGSGEVSADSGLDPQGRDPYWGVRSLGVKS